VEDKRRSVSPKRSTATGNRSYGGMNPPQSPHLHIMEAVWDHLQREQNKRQPTSKVLQEAWRTIPEDYLKQ